MKAILALAVFLTTLPALAARPVAIYGTWVYTQSLVEVRMQISANETTVVSNLMGCQVTLTYPSAADDHTYTILRSASATGSPGQCRAHVDAGRGTYVIRGNSLTLSISGRSTTYTRAR